MKGRVIRETLGKEAYDLFVERWKENPRLNNGGVPLWKNLSKEMWVAWERAVFKRRHRDLGL